MIKKRYKDNKVAYLLLAPWLVGFIGMWLIPMCISIYYSFTDFNLLNDPQFIGAANYVRAFTQDKTFYKALKVTFLLSRKLRKSAKIVYNGLEIKNHITKERM